MLNFIIDCFALFGFIVVAYFVYLRAKTELWMFENTPKYKSFKNWLEEIKNNKG